MTVCYFGNYEPEYNRNRVIINGLKKNNVEVIECQENYSVGIIHYFRLLKKLRQLIKKQKIDLIIVGAIDFSRPLVILVKLFFSTPVVWDAFYSVYEARVYDRQWLSKRHPKAILYYVLEWLCTKLADVILLDTNQHIDYFVKLFKANPHKFLRVFVGADNELFLLDKNNEDQTDNIFLVEFYGKYIPLQGVEYIIRAAKILEKYSDIKFKLIGNGQTYVTIRKLAVELDIKNIEFISDRLPYTEIVGLVAGCQVGLGIFGANEKTQRVIPNKVYEMVAMKKPVISANTPAIKELFCDRQDILLCHAADADDLAAKILELKNNSELRHKIAKAGYETFKVKATPQVVVAHLLVDLKEKLI